MKKLKTVLLLLNILLMAIILPGCKKSTSDPVPVPVIKNKIAYIYQTDNTDGLVYKTILETGNCSVTLIEKSAVTTTDYGGYKLIVIDNNTNLTTTQTWTNADTAAINGPGKPILFIGAGGMFLADKMGNRVAWGGCAVASAQVSCIVTDSSSSIYKSPKAITIPAGNALPVYSSPNSMVCFFAPVPSAVNVTLIGRLTNTSYYPVCFEKNRYGMFGFTGNFSTLTQTGKDFLVNISYYVGNLIL